MAGCSQSLVRATFRFSSDASSRFGVDICATIVALFPRVKGRIHTGSGSVPDSSEPYASGRHSVGFAFTLHTTDPTRTVRVHFAVYTLRLLRDRL